MSLFTGAGGIDLGLEAAGFELLKAVERDADARKTLIANRPNWTLDASNDVFAFAKHLSPASLGLKAGELDLLAGGPPCQPFSKAAQWSAAGRLGASDQRASCIDAMVDVAAALRPKIILVENVPGFVQRPDSGLKLLTDGLRRILQKGAPSYKISTSVLSADEFGVPQRRRRSFVVGIRDDLKRAYQWPMPLGTSEARSSWDALSGLDINEPPRLSGRWAGLLPCIPAGSNYMYLTPEGKGAPLFGARTRFWSFLLKLHPALPAWTLPATPGPSTGPFHWDNRPLAAEEMARIQTFPCGWKLEGSRHAAVRQVGNAAPPLLVEMVGRQLIASLGQRQPAELVYRLASAGRPPRAPRAMSVPPDYMSRCGDHATHKGTGQGPRPRSSKIG